MKPNEEGIQILRHARWYLLHDYFTATEPVDLGRGRMAIPIPPFTLSHALLILDNLAEGESPFFPFGDGPFPRLGGNLTDDPRRMS